jgi:hypothetical protein
MEEEFYATLKLVSGEEIMAKVCPCDEHDRIVLLIESPVLVKEINLTRMNISGLQFEPWIKMSDESMFFLDMEKVLTMSEILNDDILKMYKKFVSKNKRYNKNTSCKSKITKEMGYISTLDEFKSKLERLYKGS